MTADVLVRPYSTTTTWFPEWMRRNRSYDQPTYAPEGTACVKCGHVNGSDGDLDSVLTRAGKCYCLRCANQYLNGECAVELVKGWSVTKGWRGIPKEIRRLVFIKAVAIHTEPYVWRIYGTPGNRITAEESARRAAKKLVEYAERTGAMAYVRFDAFASANFANSRESEKFVEVYLTDGLAGVLEQYLDECRGSKEWLTVKHGPEAPVRAHDGLFYRYSQRGKA